MTPATIQPHTGSFQALWFHHDAFGAMGKPGEVSGGIGGGKLLMVIGLSFGPFSISFSTTRHLCCLSQCQPSDHHSVRSMVPSYSVTRATGATEL